MRIVENRSRQITSQKITYENSLRKTIVGYFDYLERPDGKPFIIIVPGYAETKKDYISTAYYLVSNGFNVVRYDHTCHLGESEGEIFDTNPKGILSDLSATLDFVERVYGETNGIILTSSVATRFALRTLANDRRAKLLISLVGVVNVQRTIASVYREDLIREYQTGQRWDTIDLFGHEVKGEFLGALIEERLHDLSSTIDDMKQISAPVVFFAAEDDAWVDVGDVAKVCKASRHPKSGLVRIPKALHRIEENPYLARKAILGVVQTCLKHNGGVNAKVRKVRAPTIHEISSQNKLELETLRSRTEITKKGEKNFWTKYLTKYSVIMRSSDYQNFLRVTERVLGEVRNGDKILDAGCGNGHFGMWLLRNIYSKPRPEMFLDGGKNGNDHKPYTFVGLDFAEPALLEARVKHESVIQEYYRCREDNSLGTKSHRFFYVLADLEEALPFQDEYFDKICCNLVVSYLDDPAKLIGRLMQVLKKDGFMVVSTLKPYCDLSLLYKNYAESVQTPEEREEAKALLSSSGKIRQKESEGHYRFFSEAELAKILKQAGARGVRVLRTLGNQANLAVAQK